MTEKIEFPVDSKEHAIELFMAIVLNAELIGFDEPWNPDEGLAYGDNYDGPYKWFSLETIHESDPEAVWNAEFVPAGYNPKKETEKAALHIFTLDDAATTEEVARRITEVEVVSTRLLPEGYVTFRSNSPY